MKISTLPLTVTTLSSTHKEAIVTELIEALAATGVIKDKSRAIKDIMEREDLMSTGIGNDVAIPHAKTIAVDHMCLVLGRAPEGADYKALDGRPCHLFFLILSPDGPAETHVKTLARVARLLRQRAVRDDLLAAKDEREVKAILEHYEVR